MKTRRIGHSLRAMNLVAWIAAFVVVGAALAGATGGGSNPVGAGKDRRPEAPPLLGATGGSGGTGQDQPGKTSGAEAHDNHGACVSTWAHEAKDQDLHGRFFGSFVSEVAQSNETGENCDFAGALERALGEQEAEGTPGGSAEARSKPHGRSADAPGRGGSAPGKSGEHRGGGS